MLCRRKDAKHYYVHGKYNIPFHTIILPAFIEKYCDGVVPQGKNNDEQNAKIKGYGLFCCNVSVSAEFSY